MWVFASPGRNPSRLMAAALVIAAVGLGLFVAGGELLTVLGVLLGVTLLAGTMAEPLVGVGAALLLGPLRAWLEITMPGPAPHIGQLALVAAMAAWVIAAVPERRLRFPLHPVFGPLIAFLGVGLLSLWQPSDVWGGALELLKWVQVLAIGALVYDRVRQDRHRVWLVVALFGLSAAFQAVVGLWQFGLRGEGVEQFAISDRFYRAYGTFQQPNPYAGLLGLAGAFLLGAGAALLYEGWVSGERLKGTLSALPLIGASLLTGAGLLASWSRGGWMGFGIAGLVLLALLPRRAILGIALFGVLAVTGVGLAITGRLPDAVLSRLTGFTAYVRFEDVRGVGITDDNFAVMERMAHWQAALDMWRSRFWGGIGLGGYEAAYPDHALINWPLPLGHAHNFYLNLLAEVGLIGLVAYAAWLATMLGASVWATRQTSGLTRGIALGLVGAWTHLAVHSLVDNLLVNNVHMHVGVLVGLTAWVVLVARGEAT